MAVWRWFRHCCLEAWRWLGHMLRAPVHGTVPRPLSSQFVYDNITLIQQPYDPRVAMNKQITIPVNTTRIILGFRQAGKTLGDNRELLGKAGGLLANSTGLDELGYSETPANLGRHCAQLAHHDELRSDERLAVSVLAAGSGARLDTRRSAGGVRWAACVDWQLGRVHPHPRRSHAPTWHG